MTEPKRTVDLGVWRTPLEPAPRLAKHIGLLSDDLWIKRDDWLGLLPFGGSNASAALGYLACATELEEQAPDAVHFVVAVGSGGTMAGLVAGLGADRVLGVDAGAVGDAEDRVAGMVSELRDAGHAPGDSSARSLRLDRDQVGPGYEALTEQARTAMTDAGRCEAVILDPVYTAKAFAGLSAAVRSGEIRPGQRTVFVHTGGLPGLYGHPVASELATRIVKPASGPA